ncbi:uncharacterized protein LOC126885679 [Diabrotica virgifera virgifera]|uniref:Uncharacterized protein LOC114343423 n=1 Tax=Diabrotica virgifera virgifera TaxID=50390 RepID=A0A6P7H1V0_DIAVI|nr:uncharacterized protein LOC126885679 [Diabrotica virgifera virgifera]
MKFVYFPIFLVAFTSLVYTQNYIKEQEYAVERIAPDWYAEDNLDLPFLPRDCFRPVHDHKKGSGCPSTIVSWRWDMKAESCKLAAYGGCKPSKNLFFSMRECIRVAQPVCKRLIEDLKNYTLLDLLDMLIYKIQDDSN